MDLWNEDISDIVLLMLVFAVGWALFQPGSPLAWLSLQLVQRPTGATKKVVDEFLVAHSPPACEELTQAVAEVTDPRLRVASSTGAQSSTVADLTFPEAAATPPGRSLSHCDEVASASTRLGELVNADIALVRAYGRQRRADLAVDLWWMRHREEELQEVQQPQDGASASQLYCAALEACISCGDFESAARLVRGNAWRAPLSIAGQTALLALARWFARRQDLASARQCVAAVQCAGGSVSFATIRTLLHASARGNDMVQASELFRELVSSGIDPDLSTYSTMIRGYCSTGHLEEAMVFLHAMRRRGLTPDAPLFEALLDRCASKGMTCLTEQVLADMEASGLHPSSSTLASLARLYGGQGQLDRALAAFEELPHRHGFEADAHAYGALIAACMGDGRPDLALEVFDRMSRAGCQASARTYEILVHVCLRRGDLNRAVSLVDDALGLHAAAASDTVPHILPSSGGAQRVLLEPKVVEELLRLIGRRREVRSLGVPLLQRLQAVGFEVPASLAEAMLRSAGPPSLGAASSSPLAHRRAEMQRWRSSFPSIEAAAAAADEAVH